MLILGRNLDEPLVINGNIFIKVVKGRTGNFKIAIDAPPEVPIIRGELFPGIEEKEAQWAVMEQRGRF